MSNGRFKRKQWRKIGIRERISVGIMEKSESLGNRDNVTLALSLHGIETFIKSKC
jgi:hypothetical protein